MMVKKTKYKKGAAEAPFLTVLLKAQLFN